VARKDKPYRVYRGGRTSGPIRPETSRQRPDRARDGRDASARDRPRSPRRRRRWLRVVGVLVLVAVLLVVVWAVLGYLAFRSGVREANDRLDPRAQEALSTQEGLPLSSPSTTLVLGTDEGPNREGPFRSDAILVVRTDPDEHRIAYLSIPRDLRVEIPGHGLAKINAAYAFGGPALAVDTVRSVTGLEIDHVVVLNFLEFGDVIRALGGVTIDVKRPILSNKFECPRSTKAECDRWEGWRFRRGEQRMGAHRALVYARVRENQLDPRDNDITRGERQQQVLQAIVNEAVGLGSFVRMPFIGDELVQPLATDLTANELLQLGWVKYRTPASGTLRCRLGGTIADLDGQSVILGSEENVSVIAMVTGDSAPQPPRPGSGPFGPGCRVGAG
jgi:polyisoprenyl-teichoic acid--peptidoglycan teichoic acid transferase